MAQCLISDNDISCACKREKRKLRAAMKTAYGAGRLMPPVRHFVSVDDANLYGSETVLCGFTLPLSLTPVSFLFFSSAVR
jgi:hypothetical protein